MREYRLGNLYSRLHGETRTLLSHFDRLGDARAKYKREALVIRLQAAWYRFCRELVIQSAACTPVTTTGVTIPKAPKIATRQDVIPRLRALQPRKVTPYWEPRWHAPTECIKAAQDLRVNNFISISSGLGMTPSPVENIRLVRNFIAHRNDDTAMRMKPALAFYSLKSCTPADLLLTHLLPPTGSPIFEIWVNQIDLMAQIAIQ